MTNRRYSTIVKNAASFWGLSCSALGLCVYPSTTVLGAESAPVVGAGASAEASTKAAHALSLPAKPAWLTELSLAVKEGYDDNLFGSGVPPLEQRSSWFSTVIPKLGVDLAKLFGDAGAGSNRLQKLSVAYAPELTWYTDASGENYVKHNVPVALQGRAGAFSYNLDTAFRYVQGERQAPIYPAGYTAYGIAFPRERREQIQDRSKITLRYDGGAWFLRPTASLLYYDLMTEQRNAAGYLNYVDRYDANGGLDAGYRLSPKVAAFVGYRYGHQEQQGYAWDPTNYSNDYHRALAGLEGSLFRWLKLEVALGPEFHHYPRSDTPAAFRGPDLVTPFADASLTAQLTARDTLALKIQCRQWVNSTGRGAYLESSYDLGYQRKLTSKLALEANARVGECDYCFPSVRDDRLYAFSGALRYSLTAHLSAALEYSADLGRNGQEGVAQPGNREFTRQIVGLGVKCQY